MTCRSSKLRPVKVRGVQAPGPPRGSRAVPQAVGAMLCPGDKTGVRKHSGASKPGFYSSEGIL